MDITQWYAIGLGGLLGLYPITFLSLKVFQKIIRPGLQRIGPQVRYKFLKHVYYPQTHRYLRGSEKATRFDLLVTIVFLVAMVVCTAIRVQDIPGLRRRSGL